MWIDQPMKVPNQGEWLAVYRVTDEGKATVVTYLSDIPSDFERELDAVQQRWTLRATWPEDAEIRTGARIRDFYKYPEEAPQEAEA